MKKYYIKERHNPQFSKHYYIKLGQMFKKDAKKYKDTFYGSNVILSYDTEEEYNAAAEKFTQAGFAVQ